MVSQSVKGLVVPLEMMVETQKVVADVLVVPVEMMVEMQKVVAEGLLTIGL
jgi:hypothetical protein